MKIGIIGTGSAAAVCAAVMFGVENEFLDSRDIRVSIISNPDIPKMSIGESLSPGIFRGLSTALKLKHSIKEHEQIDLILRIGARHSWENNENSMFDINYVGTGAHMSSEKFSDFVFKRINEIYDNRLLEIHDNIKHISQTDNVATAHGENATYSFDYLFDCRGFPTKEELNSGKYNFPEFETVNSVLLFQHHQQYNHPYTEVLFHKNGWQFGINTRNRKAFGYLYNKDITDKEEALKHFKELNKDIPIDNVKELYWPSYSVKKPINGRIISMGNKLYFYEPIQGIPLHNYFYFTRHILLKLYNITHEYESDLLINKFTNVNLPFEEMLNTLHSGLSSRLFDLIVLNYVGNMMYSDFWKITKNKSIKYLLKKPDWIDFCNQYVNYKNGKGDYPHYVPHPNAVIRQYLEGLNVDPEKFVNGEYSVTK
ncbi:hypothetical protein EB001_23320 [bacterium]|nr:hypothetical protein [bacterium]